MSHIIQVIAQPLFFIIYKLLYKLEVRDVKNLQGIQKPILIISNHRSINDPWLIGASLPMFSRFLPVYYIGGTRFNPPLLWLYKIGIISLVYWLFGAFALPNEGTFEEKIQPIIKILKQGNAVVMFPEGGRKSRTGIVGEFKAGTAEVFLRTGIPILPVGIKKLNEHNRTLRVVFGKSFMPLSKNTEEITRELRTVVVGLLQ